MVEFFSFEDIGEVSTIKAHSLQISLKTGGRIVVSTAKAASIRDLVSQFIVEARSGQFEYARVLADFTSSEENALQLSAGEIVAVVPKVGVLYRRKLGMKHYFHCFIYSYKNIFLYGHNVERMMSTPSEAGFTASRTVNTASSPVTSWTRCLRAQ